MQEIEMNVKIDVSVRQVLNAGHSPILTIQEVILVVLSVIIVTVNYQTSD